MANNLSTCQLAYPSTRQLKKDTNENKNFYVV